MKAALLITVFTLTLCGCAKTNITSFTDPNFENKKYSSCIIATPNLNLAYSQLLQRKICKEMEGVGVSCIQGLEIFPPTRTLTAEDKAEIINENNIESCLQVYYSNGATESHLAGTLSFGTANVYGNSASLFGSATPVYSMSRRDSYDLILIDTQTLQKAWVGGASVHAAGLANVTDDVFTTSLSKKVTTALKDAGHL